MNEYILQIELSNDSLPGGGPSVLDRYQDERTVSSGVFKHPSEINAGYKIRLSEDRKTKYVTVNDVVVDLGKATVLKARAFRSGYKTEKEFLAEVNWYERAINNSLS